MHKVGKRYLVVLGGTTCFAASFAVGWPQVPSQKGQSMATRERVVSADWWPTKSQPGREEYIGPVACAGCHPAEAAIQETTPMAKAGALPAGSKVLAAHEQLSFHLGPYDYDLTRAEGRSVFSVSDGTH